MTDAIPRFYLYGEPHRTASDDFVHVERLDDRSRPSEWTIKPHSHADLAQIFVIDGGGGEMRIEAERLAFEAPCLLVVPARAVHGFVWLRDSSGFVVTIAMPFLEEIARRDRDLAAVARAPRVVALGADDLAACRRGAEAMMRELGWAAIGHRAAVEAALLVLIVTCLRGDQTARAGPPSRGRHAATVARLRRRIEGSYRLREPIAVYARALGVSETALRVSCAAVAGCAPMAMLDQRTLLEARRLLLYSHLSVAEIGYALGFQDPAYFSRFFARHAGIAPLRFRQAGGGTRTDEITET